MEEKILNILRIIFRFIEELPGNLWAFCVWCHVHLREWIVMYPGAAALFIELLVVGILLYGILKYFTHPVADQPEIDKLKAVNVRMVADKKSGIIALLLVFAVICFVASLGTWKS